MIYEKITEYRNLKIISVGETGFNWFFY